MIHEIMKQLRQGLVIAKGEAIWLYASRVGAILSQSLMFFVLAAVFGTSKFGQFSFMFSAAQITSVIVSAGAGETLLRVLPEREAKYSGAGNLSIIAISFARTAILTALCMCLLYLSEWIFDDKTISAFKQEAQLILVVGFLMASIDTAVTVVRVLKSPTLSMMIRDSIPYLVFLVAIVVCSVAGFHSANILFFAFGVSSLISLIVALMIVAKSSNQWTFRSSVKVSAGSDYKIFWGLTTVGSAFSQLDMMVARYFFGDSTLGVYALIRRVANLVSLPQVIANWALSVGIAFDYASGNRDALEQHAIRGLVIAVPMALVIGLVLSLSSPIWMGLFHIDITFTIFSALLVLIFGQLFNVMSGANLLFACQCGEGAYVLKSRIVAFLTGTIMMWLGAHFLSIFGLAIGVAFSIVLLNVLVTYHVRKTLGIWTAVPIPGISTSRTT